MAKSFSLFATLAVILTIPDQAAADGKFLVFDYRDLVNKSSSWSSSDQVTLKSFPNKNSLNSGSIRYIIIPNETTPRNTYQNWVLIEEPCGDATGSNRLASFGGQELRTLLWRLLVERKISTASDIVVLDDEDVSNLILMSWWSRASTAKDVRREAPHSFDTQFLQNIRYSWFLNPHQEQRLLIIRGLITSVARVYVALPEHQGSAPLFEVNSQDRAILETAITLLRQDSIFCSLSVTLQEKGSSLKVDEMKEILRRLSIRLVKPDEESMGVSNIARKPQGGSGRSEWSVVLARRDVLASSKIVFEIPSLEDVWFVDEANKSLTRILEFDIPKAERVLQEGMKKENVPYTLPIVRFKNVPGFQSHSIWHSTAEFKEADLSIDPKPLLEEYERGVLDGNILPLFESPRDFLRKIDKRRKTLREQDAPLIAAINSTGDVREAVWQQVSIGLALSAKENAPILLIKQVGTPTTSIQTRNRIDWSFSLLHSFLKQRLAGKKNEILVSESRTTDPIEVGKISIFVLPGAD